MKSAVTLEEPVWQGPVGGLRPTAAASWALSVHLQGNETVAAACMDLGGDPSPAKPLGHSTALAGLWLTEQGTQQSPPWTLGPRVLCDNKFMPV